MRIEAIIDLKHLSPDDAAKFEAACRARKESTDSVIGQLVKDFIAEPEHANKKRKKTA